jgi:hypothetical protein
MSTPLKYVPLPNYDYFAWNAGMAAVSDLRQRYVKTEADATVMSDFSKLLVNRAQAMRTWKPDSKMGFIVTAESGAGKTTMLRRLFREHPALQARIEIAGQEAAPVIEHRLESPLTLKSLGEQTSEALGYLVKRDHAKAAIWTSVKQRLEALKVQVLWFDEAQDIFKSANSKDIADITSTLKGLMNHSGWPVVLVLSGTPDLLEFAKSDKHLMRRVVQMQIPPLSSSETSPDVDAVRFVAEDFSKRQGLDCDIDHNTLRRVIHAADEQMGRAFEFTVDAILEAVMAGSPSLTPIHFAHAYERHAHCGPTTNILYAPDNVWPLIVSLLTREQPTPLVPTKSR